MFEISSRIVAETNPFISGSPYSNRWKKIFPPEGESPGRSTWAGKRTDRIR
ncbi:MAG: hypothetical protein ACLFNY_06300 [Candidatus Aenigmatarchaeota archaeon]